jgi:hypothetical protein
MDELGLGGIRRRNRAAEARSRDTPAAKLWAWRFKTGDMIDLRGGGLLRVCAASLER